MCGNRETDSILKNFVLLRKHMAGVHQMEYETKIIFLNGIVQKY